MPKEFDNCVAKGGKVRRKSLKAGKYINICFLNGKSYSGEVHESKKKSKKESQEKPSWSDNL